MAIGTGAAAWLESVRRPRASLAAAGTLAVVGNGMASHRLCARLSETPASGRRVVVIAEEPRPAYDRVHLSDVLGGRDAAELELASADWYRERGIELWLGDPAVRVDLAERRVETRGGNALRFDRLVFATGSAPVLPPLPGVGLPGVHVYRSADDVHAIAGAAEAALARGATAGIIGGGLLGIELAGALRRLGLRVVVLERATHLLPRQLDVAASRVLERQIRALGIRLALGRRIDALEPAAAGVRVRTNEDGSADFAFVVVAAGVQPRDALARAAGLACHERGGILVDDRLGASAANVYAVGECARHAGVSYGLAAPCLAMADALADRLCGGRRRFRRVAPATRLKLAEVDVSVAGEAHLDGPLIARVTHARADAYRSLVLNEGRVVGAVAVGDWPEWARVQEAIASHRLMLPWQRLRLTRKGVVWPRGGGTPISRWPDATTVCSCTGVDCGALRAALADGCRSASELAARTGAAGVCGSCRPLLEALSGERSDAARESAGGGLLPSGLAAAALVGLIALAPPIALAASVRGGELAARLDALWRDDLARQVTGFATLAICAGSLLFSLRKRWPRLARLSYTRWRGLHAALGVGTLLGLGAHTGFRMGVHLDRALVICFLVLAGLGALAGVATALESRLSPAAGSRLRRATSGVHALAFWPFPVLVFFHVLKTYWY